ncbi:glycosyltransferase family 2 protein [Xylanibacter oryzae]|uniref:glycosyltransferase family 2 protein n=1 Tax=Xylanibacter oryzae TaxID=185293 RepID=UPI0005617C36|nr:glycosyltransferase family 2 protein [Xylanibacter oryzae]
MKLSIITINYNNSKGLENTIKSIISQDFKDYEYIVIDGGSNDSSIDIIKKYSDKIDYWVSEPDKGIYNAMNKGVSHAHGEYSNFMNSGDIFYNSSVLKSVFSNHYKEDIITGVTIGTDENSIRFDTEKDVTFLTLYRSTISHQASFIKTEFLRKYPYNEELKIVSDWEFWIKTLIVNNCSHVFDKNIIAKVDTTGISVTNNEERESERRSVLIDNIPARILKDYEPLKYADDQMIKYIAKISKTYRLHKITSFLLRTICKLIR